MDQSVISGALLFFPEQFGIENEYGGWVTGIVAAAPYFSCALLASFLTAPLNNHFGRRGTIAITCAIASITCIWSAVTDSWWCVTAGAAGKREPTLNHFTGTS
jgi:MFS family permease